METGKKAARAGEFREISSELSRTDFLAVLSAAQSRKLQAAIIPSLVFVNNKRGYL